MHTTTYATKAWNDLSEVVQRHPKAGLLILNNSPIKVVDIGSIDQPYYLPELEAVKQCTTEYILWYSGDVVPPEEDWTVKAIKLLKRYPIVSPFWEQNYEDYVRTAHRQERYHFKEMPWGFEDYFFSDQAYIAKTETMRNIDYDSQHSIAQFYPQHGGDSFEKRVAQWLAVTGKKRAVLKDYRYKHITREEK